MSINLLDFVEDYLEFSEYKLEAIEESFLGYEYLTVKFVILFTFYGEEEIILKNQDQNQN